MSRSTFTDNESERQMDEMTKAKAGESGSGPYVVKCDECKVVIRACGTVRESAEGGTCDDCNKAIAARIKAVKA